MQIKTEQGIKDAKILDVTPENYVVPKGEEHQYHAIIEVQQFNSQTGQRLSIPRLQKFGLKTFEAGGVRSNLIKQGYTVTVLHDPKQWIAQNKDAAEKAAAENAKRTAEAKAKADADAKEKAATEQQNKINEAVNAALEKQSEATQKAIDAAVAAALKQQTTVAKPAAEAKAKAEPKTEASK